MYALLLFLFLLAVVAVIALAARSEKLGRRVYMLEERLSRLEGVRRGPESPVHVPTHAATPAPPLAPPAPAPPSLVRPSQPVNSRSREEWEALVGGKFLNRIGALALVVGVAFFLKHAFDQNWITESFRVIIGGAAGVGLLIVADRAHRKDFAVFAQGLVGAGIAVLALSVYASFNFYSLVSQPVAFILMSIVTVIAFAQAFRYDSPAVALLGWLGGFLTPFLLSTGQTNQIGLYTYLLLLDAGIIQVVRFKERWLALEPLALGGTWVIALLWWMSEYRSAPFGISLLYFALFWGIFHGVDIFRELRGSLYPLLRRGIGWGNWFFATLGLWLLVDHSVPDRKGLAFLLFALVALCSAGVVFRRRGKNTAAFPHTMVAAGILLGFAIVAEADRFTIPILLGAEAICFTVFGSRIREQIVWRTGEVLIGVCVVALATTAGALSFVPPSEYFPVWNLRALAFVVLAAAFGAAGRSRRDGDHGPFTAFTTYGWVLTLLILATVEVSDIFLARGVDAADLDLILIHFHRVLSLALVWTGAGFFLLLLARGNQRREFAAAGIWILLLGVSFGTLRGVFYSPVELFVPAANFRCIALLLFGTAMLLAVPIVRELRNRIPWLGKFVTVARIAAALIFFLLLTGEILDIFRRLLAELGVRREEWADDRIELENLKQLAVSGGWLLFSIGLMATGLIRRLRSLRVMAILLFALTTSKVFFFDLSFLELSYRFISAIALGIILLAVSYLYRRYREIINEPSVE